MRSFKHIAELIRDKRLSHPKKYSQSELSNLLGYKNGQFISNVERGLCSVPLKGLKKLTEVLNVTEDQLKSAVLNDFESTLNHYMEIGELAAEEQTAPHDFN